MAKMLKIPKILVIDDDDSIRSTLALTLEAEGYTVDTAKDGEEAIAKSYSNFFNLAIVDWRLPDIAGTDLLGKLKETTPKMAKIMLTGYPSMNTAIDAVNKRADAFLVKPPNMDELLAKIKELLKLQEETDTFSQFKVVQFIENKTKEIMDSKKKR
jgi:DNA-binding response OmpR family regulator